MLIVGSDDNIVRFTKNILKSSFDMKYMGLTYVILRIKFSRTSTGLTSSQSHYMDNILGKFNKDDFAVVRTPLDIGLHLFKNRDEGLFQVEYSKVIDGLMCLTSCKGPNLTYTIRKLARYTSNPGTDYWKAIVRVLN